MKVNVSKGGEQRVEGVGVTTRARTAQELEEERAARDAARQEREQAAQAQRRADVEEKDRLRDLRDRSRARYVEATSAYEAARDAHREATLAGASVETLEERWARVLACRRQVEQLHRETVILDTAYASAAGIPRRFLATLEDALAM